MKTDIQTNIQKQNRKIIRDILFLGILLALIVFSFYSFTTENRQRIIEQNNSFIEAAARQTARRISDLIRSSQQNVQLLAKLYSATIPQPDVDAELLRDMTEHSTFDYVEFISKD